MKRNKWSKVLLGAALSAALIAYAVSLYERYNE